MREYKILTDSTTDLSPQLVAQTGVTVLPPYPICRTEKQSV